MLLGFILHVCPSISIMKLPFIPLALTCLFALLCPISSAVDAITGKQLDKLFTDSVTQLEEQANKGDSYAMQQLSRQYALAKQTDLAMQWHDRYVQQLTKEAEAGSSTDMLKLAGFYLRGSEFQQPQRDQAKFWLERASLAGEPSGAYLHATMLEKEGNKSGANAAYARSYMLYAQQAEKEDKRADALYWMGIHKLHGQGVESNIDEAIAHLKEAASLDSLAAIERLFHSYATGTGVAKDEAKSLYYARVLADKHGHGGMAFLLYNDYEKKGEKQLAQQYLDRACELHHPLAMLKQAELLKTSQPEKSEELLRHAHSLGESRATVALAKLEKARGERGNSELMLGYLAHAAELQNPEAALMLAQYYESVQDDAKSNQWYVIASDQGLKEAFAKRGMLHMIPHRHLEWNPTMAYQWWKLGDEAGDPESSRHLKLFLYVFIPCILFVAFLLPVLLMLYIIRRRKKKAKRSSTH